MICHHIADGMVEAVTSALLAFLACTLQITVWSPCGAAQIQNAGATSSNTRLLFCTSGVLLRRVIGEFDLQGVTHVVLDEIHERQTTEDFLLIILRDLLRLRPGLKVVLMSATVDPGVYRVRISSFLFKHGTVCFNVQQR